jgi:predicted pyridoxine 5'-phosphate oxidase superfamily flavin-nucleotide-binding protein
MPFKVVITDPAQFRELMGKPPPPCVAKTIAILDRHCRTFIARSPFVLIASASVRGQMDISPKGDAQGFVRVLDGPFEPVDTTGLASARWPSKSCSDDGGCSRAADAG